MQKVVKFGGSSLADANQFQKVKNIIQADSSRRIVVVSALGKRNKSDHKITDLLFLTGAHLKYGVDAKSVFDIVKERYFEVKTDLNLSIDLEKEFTIEEVKEALKEQKGIILYDDPKNHIYPNSIVAKDNDAVYVGRIRKDLSCKNGLLLYCVADNIRKGAAANAVQIALALDIEKCKK